MVMPAGVLHNCKFYSVDKLFTGTIRVCTLTFKKSSMAFMKSSNNFIAGHWYGSLCILTLMFEDMNDLVFANNKWIIITHFFNSSQI